jgi:hypothetical protein
MFYMADLTNFPARVNARESEIFEKTHRVFGSNVIAKSTIRSIRWKFAADLHS